MSNVLTLNPQFNIPNNTSSAVIAAAAPGKAIHQLSFNNIITSCTAGQAVQLPVQPILAQPYVIVNDGTASCVVNPGNFYSSINGLVGNGATGTIYGFLTLPVNAKVSLIAVSNAPVDPQIQSSTTNNITWYSYGDCYPLPAARLTLGLGAQTIISAASGITYILPTGGAAITLPAVSLGLKYRFVTSAVGTVNSTITAGAAIMFGSVVNAATVSAGSPKTTITFVFGSNLVGDYVEMESDGVNWYYRACATTAGAITVA